MSNTVDFDLDDVYIDGLTINGNLTVKGVLYMTTSLNKIPDELETTPYKNIVLDEDTTFRGNLHIKPRSKVNISGTIKSKFFRTNYT